MLGAGLGRLGLVRVGPDHVESVGAVRHQRVHIERISLPGVGVVRPAVRTVPRRAVGENIWLSKRRVAVYQIFDVGADVTILALLIILDHEKAEDHGLTGPNSNQYIRNISF